MFFLVDGSPYYEYAPFQCSEEEYETWQEEMMVKHKEHTWNCNIYYRIDTISCVLVLRNKIWAQAAIEKLREVWDIIVYERQHGYEHRMPKQRTVKTSGKTTVVKLDEFANINMDKEDIGPAPCILANPATLQKRPRNQEETEKSDKICKNEANILFVETETN